jgi:integrase
MYRVLFQLAIFTGARQGELLGLKWTDFDWKNSQVHIRRTFNNGQFFSPKTKGSRRKIDIGPQTIRELKKWRLACPSSSVDLVFPNEAGGPVNYSNMMQRYFYAALAGACLPLIRFHDLRHTYASIQLELGRSIKYIQKQLGHSSPTVTWNVYAHLMKSVNQQAAQELEENVLGEKWAPNGHQAEVKQKKKVTG